MRPERRTDQGGRNQVVANRRGRINRVLPGPDPEPLPGWYAYLTRPLLVEGMI